MAAVLLAAVSGNAQNGGQVFFQTTTFGIVGLAQNQVARLNVLNPGNPTNNRSPVCSAEMKFVDDQAHELKSSIAPVDWDKAVSLELDRSEIPGGTNRVQIRGILRTAINAPDPSNPFPVMPGSVCSFMPTLEIFNKQTGKTELILSESRSIVLQTPATRSRPTPR